MKHLQALYSKYKTDWINNDRYTRYHAVLDNVDGYIDALKSHRALAEKSGHLTKDGITASVRDFAAKSIVPKLRRELDDLDQSAAKLSSFRKQLAVVKVDKSDAQAAAIRAQIRDRLAALPDAKRASVLLGNPDEITVAAVLEAPNYLSGVSQEVLGKMMEFRAQKTKPDVLAKIQEEEEVLAIANAAIRIGLAELRKEGEFLGREGVFNDWMTEASAPVEREIEARKNARKAAANDPSNPMPAAYVPNLVTLRPEAGAA
jgi:hypothetical protein